MNPRLCQGGSETLTVAPFGPVIPWGPRTPWLPCKVDKDEVTFRMLNARLAVDRGEQLTVTSGSHGPFGTDHAVQGRRMGA